MRAQISFDRPELSPCLAKLEKGSPEYSQALEIIRAGQRQLQLLPRADMDGFTPCTTDLERLMKYEQRTAIEQASRAAIRDNRKTYDADFQ
jgi:hypothetical protein